MDYKKAYKYSILLYSTSNLIKINLNFKGKLYTKYKYKYKPKFLYIKK